MAFNDFSDMLARIKNAHQEIKYQLVSKIKIEHKCIECLKDEGYIRDFKNIEERKGVSSIKLNSNTLMEVLY